MNHLDTKILPLIKAVADRNRLRILKMLQAKQMCVCELTAVLGIRQPSVSRHLMLLRNAGLVRDMRDGQWIIYRLAEEDADRRVADLLALLEGWLEDDPQVRADRRVAEKLDREAISCDGSIRARDIK